MTSGTPLGGDDAAATRAGRVLLRVPLTHPVAVRGLAAVVGGIVVIVWPSPTEAVIARLIGVVLVTSTVWEVWARRRHPSNQPATGRIAGSLVVGTILTAWPDATLKVLGIALGVGLIAWGLVEAARAPSRRTEDEDWLWGLTRGLLALSAGAVLLILGDEAVAFVTVGIGVIWVLAGLVAMAHTREADPDDTESIDAATAGRIVVSYLARHELTAERRLEVEEALFFEGEEMRGRVIRFAALMFFSVSIATFAVLADSTAVVIGAMLVAPLMTPIMATAVGLLQGRPDRSLRAAALVVGGAAGAIGLAWVIAGWVPDIPQLVENSQISSRTSPRMLDMLIALAAGGAGAFAMTRPDVADALPGVAIAVALVPPLAVTGVTLSQGEGANAFGSFLLFTTNLVSIILAASLVFVLTGLTTITQLRRERQRVRVAMAGVAVAVLLIAIPLGLTGQRILADGIALDEAEDAVGAWLVDDPNVDVVEIDIDGSDVLVIVAGPDRPPPTEALGALLADELGRTVHLDLRFVPEERDTITVEN